MALFRVDFSGRGELAERQQKLAQMLSRLQKISEGVNQRELDLCKKHQILIYNIKTQSARSKYCGLKYTIQMIVYPDVTVIYVFTSEYNVAVFVTNQMTADPGAGMT